MCNLILGGIVTKLFNQHHYVIPKYLITPRRNPKPINSHFPFNINEVI